MLERLKKWFGIEVYEDPPPRARASNLNRSGAFAPPAAVRPVPPPRPPVAKPQPRPAPVAPPPRIVPAAGGEITDLGPGKNVLIRNKIRPGDSGTHDILQILDESNVETAEETGIDPYNTGKFDRSRNWDKRFR